MTITDKASTLKAFDIKEIAGGQLITATQEGYSVIPEHPVNPATFVITFDTNWIIPDKYHISSLVVLVYAFRNNNKPPTTEDLLEIIQQAVTETNAVIEKERKHKGLDVDKLEIVPIDKAKTLPTLQDCLTRAYPVN